MKDRIVKTEKVLWEKIIPYQTPGLKKTNKDLMDKLKRSLKENGFSSPFYVYQKGKDIVSLDGHHRIMVLREMRLSGEKIPDKLTCNFLDIKNEKEAKLVFLAFQSHYSQMTKAGFTEFSMDMDMNNIVYLFEPFRLNWDFSEKISEKIKNDDIPVEVKTISGKGDIFELQSPSGIIHKILCGDTSKHEDVEKLMSGNKVDMVFTDPPYGVSYENKAKTINKITGSNMNTSIIIGDNLSEQRLKEYLLPAFKNIYSIMSDICSFYVTAPQGGGLGMMMMMMMMEAEMSPRHVLIWNKSSKTFSMNRLDYDYKHEPILYGWKKKHKFYGAGEHKTSVWDIAKPQKNKEHPTMKPVELVLNAILNSTKKGDIVFDGYAGSGSTLIACEQSARVFNGIEISTGYVDIILKRWVNYTKNGVVYRNKKIINL